MTALQKASAAADVSERFLTKNFLIFKKLNTGTVYVSLKWTEFTPT